MARLRQGVGRCNRSAIEVCLGFALILVLATPSIASAGAGLLDLAWDAPVTDEAGQVLGDLHGYHIYAGLDTLICPSRTLAGTIETRLHGFEPDLDADGNGIPDHTDGEIIVRYLLGAPDSALLTGIILGEGATRTTPGAIRMHLDTGRTTFLDVDGNGTGDAMIDGQLIARYLSGLRGQDLLSGTLSENGAHPTVTVVVPAADSAPGSQTLVLHRLRGLEFGRSYHVRVTAVDRKGNESDCSEEVMGVATADPDLTPPTVQVTLPADGETLAGIVIVVAAAEDDSEVSRVEFLLGGVPQYGDSTAPYDWMLDTTAIPNGSHTLSAIAHDPAGNVGSSAQVLVHVSNPGPDETPPTVAITAPAPGATVSGAVPVVAEATDDSSVQLVVFELDGVIVTAATTKPYSWLWDSGAALPGLHTLAAVATDVNGNAARSAPVTVLVTQPLPGNGGPGNAPISLDADGNGVADETDGQIILRYLTGYPDSQLLGNLLLGQGATRTVAEAVRAYLDAGRPVIMDVDGNGVTSSFSDGVLIARYLSRITGAALVAGSVIGAGATRTSATEIETHLARFMPPNLDADGDGIADGIDGKVIVRYLSGYPDTQLLAGITLGPGATRTLPGTIRNYLDGGKSLPPKMLDVDGNGTFSATTDGRLILRYLSGITGAPLVSGGAIGAGATRLTPTAIEGYLHRFVPPGPPLVLEQ